MSAVAVAILIGIVGWDGFAPFGATLEVNVLNVGACIDDIDVYTLSAIC